MSQDNLLLRKPIAKNSGIDLGKMLQAAIPFCSDGTKLTVVEEVYKKRQDLHGVVRNICSKVVPFTDLLLADTEKIADSMLDASLLAMDELTVPGFPPPWIELLTITDSVCDNCCKWLLEFKLFHLSHSLLIIGMKTGKTGFERRQMHKLKQALRRLEEPLLKLRDIKIINFTELKMRMDLARLISKAGLFLGCLEKTGDLAGVLSLKVILESIYSLEDSLNSVIYKLYNEDTLEKLETKHVQPTSRPWNVPQPRDAEFRGHQDLIEEMYSFLNGQGQFGRIELPKVRQNGEPFDYVAEFLNSDRRLNATETLVLWGVNGIGKTEIATEFAYRHALEYDGVLWVDCDPYADEEFAALTDHLEMNMNGKMNLDEIIDKVRYKLERGEKYLLIFDDVISFEELERFHPKKGFCHVLITSNSPVPYLPSVKINPLPPEQAKHLLHVEEIAASGYEVDEREQQTLDQVAVTLDFHPFSLDIAGDIMIVKKPPEHGLTPGQLLSILKKGSEELEKGAKGKKSKKRPGKRTEVPSDKFVADERFLQPTPLKNLFDAALATLVGVGSVFDVASHYAHGELGIAMLEVGGWFGPQEIPVELLGVAARKIRPVKGAAKSLSALAGNIWEGITDTLQGKFSLDDDEDGGKMEDLLLSIEKLERLGLLKRNETTNGVTFHRMVMEYARSRARATLAAKAVFFTLLGAKCHTKTVDHFQAMWAKRTWLESLGLELGHIYAIGLQLASHWTTQKLLSKSKNIVDEAFGMGKQLGDLRFAFWLIRVEHLQELGQIPAAIEEAERCLRVLPKNLALTSSAAPRPVRTLSAEAAPAAALPKVTDLKFNSKLAASVAEAEAAAQEEPSEAVDVYAGLALTDSDMTIEFPPGAALLLQAQLLFMKVSNGTRELTHGDCLDEAEKLEVLAAKMTKELPGRDTTGPYGDWVRNGPGQIVSIAYAVLGEMYSQVDLRPDKAVDVLERAVESRLKAAGPGDGLLKLIRSMLAGTYTQLLFLSFLVQMLHDAVNVYIAMTSGAGGGMGATVRERLQQVGHMAFTSSSSSSSRRNSSSSEYDSEFDGESEADSQEGNALMDEEKEVQGTNSAEAVVVPVKQRSSKSVRIMGLEVEGGHEKESGGGKAIESTEEGNQGEKAAVPDGLLLQGSEAAGRESSTHAPENGSSSEATKAAISEDPSAASREAESSVTVAAENGVTVQAEQQMVAVPGDNDKQAEQAAGAVSKEEELEAKPRETARDAAMKAKISQSIASFALQNWETGRLNLREQRLVSSQSVVSNKGLLSGKSMKSSRSLKSSKSVSSQFEDLDEEIERNLRHSKRFEKKVQKEQDSKDEVKLQFRRKWPQNTHVLGDVHFSPRLRQKAARALASLLQELHGADNSFSLEAAFLSAVLALTERRELAELVQARRRLEMAFLDAEELEKAEALTVPDTEKVQCMLCLVLLYNAENLLEQAQAYSDRCLHVMNSAKRPGPGLPLPLFQPFLFSWTLLKQGSFEATREVGLTSLKRLKERGNLRYGTVGLCVSLLGVTEFLEGHPLAAQGFLQDACALYSWELDPDHLRVADTLALIGKIQMSRGHDLEGAIHTLRHVLRIHERHLDPDHPALAFSLADLAMAIERLDRETTARHIRNQEAAYQRLKDMGPSERSQLARMLHKDTKELLAERSRSKQEALSLKQRALRLIEEHSEESELRPLRRLLLDTKHLKKEDIRV